MRPFRPEIADNYMAADPFNELIHRLRGELLAEMPAAETVVSAGCAGAWYFDWFKEKYPHTITRHIGFDLAPRPDGLPPEVDWRESTFCDLSGVPDGSVDLVFAGQAIEHVSIAECAAFLEHARRVLKPTGWLVMDSPNFSITGPSHLRLPDHVIEYTVPQMRDILKAAGFTTATCKGILLCKENGHIVEDPYNPRRIDDRRIKAAKERPEDSFIWWIEARPDGAFNKERVGQLLGTFDRAYESDRAQFSRATTRALRAARHPLRTSRQLLRRVVPRQARWFVRAIYRLATGYYIRNSLRSLQAASDQMKAYTAQIEAQGEIMDLTLRRLHRLESEVATLTEPVRKLQEDVALLAQPLPNELSSRTVGVLNFDSSHLGFRSRFGLWINDPVNLEYTPAEVRWDSTVERIVEIPFTFQALACIAPPARILDIGSCESLVPLELASLGYDVTALDIRSYAFSHPNLKSVKASILDWTVNVPYDAVVLLSTLEHLGLPLYGRTGVDEEADKRTMEKVHSLLRPGGLLVLTTPFGESRIDPTQRVYSAADVTRLLDGFSVRNCFVANRLDDKTWQLSRELPFSDLARAQPPDDQEAVVLLTAERR